MFSTLTERGAAATLDALSAGASDYVHKPSNVGSIEESRNEVRSALIPKIKALGGAQAGDGRRHRGRSRARADRRGAVVAPGTAPVLRRRTVPHPGYQVLVVGCSTGGPEALCEVLRALPPLPVPIAVVQHMPPVFTTQFAGRLDRMCAFDVREATDGSPLAPGTAVIAPGDHHLELVRGALGFSARLHDGPPENFCRPAVDPLFRSAAEVAGEAVLAVVLTGMGQDGRLGATRIVDAGGSVLVQDEPTSVVWGMPGAVAEAGLAEEVLPLEQIAPAVLRRLAASTSRSVVGG